MSLFQAGEILTGFKGHAPFANRQSATAFASLVEARHGEVQAA